MSTTSHKITADLPNIGKMDINFNYTPGKPGRRYSADLYALKAVPVMEGCELTFRELKDIAQDYLDDGGYDFACAVAKEQRGER